MKNSFLLALLLISLAVNGGVAFARWSSRSAESAAAIGARTVAAGASPANVAANTAGKSTDAPARPFVWNSPGTSDDDLRSLAGNLRAAGFPPTVVAKIVGTMLRDRAFAKVAELPFWQLNSNNREARKMQMEAGRELQRLQEAILGASGSQLATLDPNTRRERFGDLPDDKVAALLKIDRDYQDMMADAMPSGLMTQEDMQSIRAQFTTLEKERLADMKAALGPEAYADYERQNSGAAAIVMRGLRELKATEEEYNALFAAQKARSPGESGMFGFNPNANDPAQLAATYAFNDQVRAILGDERANTYLKSADPIYGQIARFAEQQPGLAPATIYQLYQLQNEAGAAMQQIMRREGNSGPVDVAKLRQTFTDLNARLDALVGPEVAKAFRAQGIGSVFRNITVRSAPAGSTAPANSGAATPPKG